MIIQADEETAMDIEKYLHALTPEIFDKVKSDCECLKINKVDRMIIALINFITK